MIWGKRDQGVHFPHAKNGLLLPKMILVLWKEQRLPKSVHHTELCKDSVACIESSRRCA